MPDEPVEEFEIRIELDETVTEDEDNRKRRRALSAIVLLALLVIIVLILLLLPRCTSDERAGRDRESEKVIDAVPNAPAEAGMVAVWISEDTDIDRVLSSGGLAGAETTDLGDGRFVVRVEQGEETDSVRRLRGIEGVHDAGFVFSDESAEP